MRRAIRSKQFDLFVLPATPPLSLRAAMRDELVCLLRALLLEVMSHHQSQAVTAEAVTAEAVTAGKEPNHEQQSHV